LSLARAAAQAWSSAVARREAMRLRRHWVLLGLVALGFWVPGTYFMRVVVPSMAPLTAGEAVTVLYALLPLAFRPEIVMALLLGSIQFAKGTWRQEREDLCTTGFTDLEIVGGKVIAPCLLLAGLNALMAAPNYAMLFTDPTLVSRQVPERYYAAAAGSALALAEDFAFSFVCVLAVYRELVRTRDRFTAALRAISIVLLLGVAAGAWAAGSAALAMDTLVASFRSEAAVFLAVLMLFAVPVLLLEAAVAGYLWRRLRREYFETDAA
jgi:ABC-type Co2+ transport system permease subunit